MKKNIEEVFEKLIFASRWIQLPLYLGLVVGLLVYSYKFFIELVHLVSHADELDEAMVMLGILSLVDITMVANLIVMVVIGGYATFVSKLDVDTHKDKPEWLDKVDAGTLKVKLAGALIGISGIHLLKAFINIKHMDAVEVQYQIIIHVVFLFTTLLLALTESILHKKH
ncbi:MAG: TIGR00645 family protein [Spirochaetia bacterium]|nr:TIGR00645 family protein [Spirochaetia bacterium]